MMKKLLGRVLAAALVVGLLSVPSLAYEFPRESWMPWIRADTEPVGTAGTVEYSGWEYTVYLFPAGTSFTAYLGIYSVATLDNSSCLYGPHEFFLPETGTYAITAMNEMASTTCVVVRASGSDPVDPEPEPEPEPEQSRPWYETDEVYPVGSYYVEYFGSSQPVIETREVAIGGKTVEVSVLPAGTRLAAFNTLTMGSPETYINGELDGNLYYDATTETLPAQGIYRVPLYSVQTGYVGDVWVTAETSGTTEPEPEEPEEPEQPQQIFSDVAPTAWYAGFVETVYEKGLFAGAGDGTFAPEANMTYAEFLTVLSQFSGETLTPVTGGAWYDTYVQWAQPLIPAGMAEDFDPVAPITRQDMAALFGTFLSLYDYSAETVNPGQAEYTDAASIADYADGGVQLCYQLGIMSGGDDGSFAPEATATRAQVAVTMVQMARVMGK